MHSNPKDRSSGPSIRQSTLGNSQNSRSNKRPWSPVNGSRMKRVKIVTSPNGTGTGTGTGKDDETEAKQNCDELDTARRRIESRGRGRSMNPGRDARGRGQRQCQRQNMGLVRVNSDDSKTPICPTFIRGIRCQNERCTLQHPTRRAPRVVHAHLFVLPTARTMSERVRMSIPPRPGPG